MTLSNLIDFAEKYRYENSVTKVESWFFMSSPWPLITVTLSYLYFVLKSGPQYMESRKPFNLKYVLFIYNAALSIFNGFIFWQALNVWKNQLFVTHSSQEEARPIMDLLDAVYWYFEMSKFVELLDTIFFVLRKKQSQVTVLHVFHHSCMYFNTWWFLKYGRCSHGNFVVLINSFVHIVMYFYYFLAAFGPKVQKYLWWKKYITIIQLTQFSFVILFLFSIMLLDSKQNPGLILYVASYTIYFAYMFLRFYAKEYTTNSSAVKKSQ